jgi:hypothetical protein
MERREQVEAMQEHMKMLGLDPTQLRCAGKEAAGETLKQALKQALQAFPVARSNIEAFQQRLICGVFHFLQAADLAAILGHALPFGEEEVLSRVFTLLEPPETQEQGVILRQLRQSFVPSGYQPSSLNTPVE